MSQESLKACKHCGQPCFAGVKVCPHCGQAIAQAGEASELIRSYDLGESFKMTPGLLLLFLAFAAALLFATLLWFFN